jgi:ABC-type nickel/cobalt efflux system permease component RcnA
MNKIRTIQLKAVFLLIVFSLNTIIGFACAVGLDMGFNSHHHEEEVTDMPVHVHADGKKHQHYNEASNHHDENIKDHHRTNDKDNCCNDHVTKIAQQDKAIAPSISIINPIFFAALISSFYNIEILLSSGVDSHIKYSVQRHHPPIPDIRVAIQSFQI